MQYVRDYYGVPVKRGQHVRQTDGIWKGRTLIVTRCTHYVHARIRASGITRCFHPLNLEYQTDAGWYRPAKPVTDG